MLLNREGKVFVGQRLDSTTEAWQMPQGGIETGENAEAAALRELGEETGNAPDKVTLVATAPDELRYDLDRKRVVSGKSVSARVDTGSRRTLHKKNHN